MRTYLVIGAAASVIAVVATATFWLADSVETKTEQAPDQSLTHIDVSNASQEARFGVASGGDSFSQVDGEVIGTSSPSPRRAATNVRLPTPNATYLSQRIADPAVMERIAEADRYLQSKFGDLHPPLDDEQRARLQQDGAFRDWMAEIESKLGDRLTPQMRQEMRERQVATVNLRNRLQEAYLSESMSWSDYLSGLRAVSLWSDEPFQRLLSEEEYQELNGVAKAEIVELSEAVLSPPEVIEAVNLFPQMRESRPELTEHELASVIPQAQLDRLMGLRKAQMLQEFELAADLDANIVDMDSYQDLIMQNESDLQAQAAAILSQEGYRLLFPGEALEQ
jgi:hypothetical protein